MQREHCAVPAAGQGHALVPARRGPVQAGGVLQRRVGVHRRVHPGGLGRLRRESERREDADNTFDDAGKLSPMPSSRVDSGEGYVPQITVEGMQHSVLCVAAGGDPAVHGGLKVDT